MNNKFCLCGDKMKSEDGKILYRILALKDFSDVKKGDLGGWVEYGNNLSQFDNSWIYDDAEVHGFETKVAGDAQIRDKALITNGSYVGENAKICGETVINSSAIFGSSVISDTSRVVNSTIQCDGTICGCSNINNSRIKGSPYIKNSLVISSKTNGNFLAYGAKIHLYNFELDSDKRDEWFGDYYGKD